MSLLLAWLVPHDACKHRLVQAPGPGLTVVFLTFLVLAQGAGRVEVRRAVLLDDPEHPDLCYNAHMV